jgi:hypothetical protein
VGGDAHGGEAAAELRYRSAQANSDKPPLAEGTGLLHKGAPPTAKSPLNPEPPPARITERKPRKPRLCSTCWQLGYPNCRTCCLVYDSSLELGPDGVRY